MKVDKQPLFYLQDQQDQGVPLRWGDNLSFTYKTNKTKDFNLLSQGILSCVFHTSLSSLYKEEIQTGWCDPLVLIVDPKG